MNIKFITLYILSYLKDLLPSDNVDKVMSDFQTKVARLEKIQEKSLMKINKVLSQEVGIVSSFQDKRSKLLEQIISLNDSMDSELLKTAEDKAKLRCETTKASKQIAKFKALL